MISTRALALAALCGAGTTVAASAPAEHRDVLTIHCQGASAWFADEKDQALYDALRLVGDRIGELPAELDDFPELPPDLLPFLGRLLNGPLDLRVGLGSEPHPEMPVPLEVYLEHRAASAEDAQIVEQHVRALFAASGMALPEPDAGGWTAVPAPLPVRFAAVGDGFAVSVGDAERAASPPAAAGLPAGAEPTLSMRLELGPLLELLEGLAPLIDDDELTSSLRVMKLAGMPDVSMTWSTGADAERAYSVFRMEGMASAVGDGTALPTLTEQALAAVPADALWAMVGAVDLQASLEQTMAGLSELGVEGNPMDLVAMFTGLHPQRDLVDHLGGHWGAYLSDTTGGGGLMSLAAFFELQDSEGILSTRDRVAGLINGIGMAEADGYVRARDWARGNTEYTTLTFPGVPIPLEPTLAVTDEYLIVGITPQAALGAVHQVEAGSRGLLQNERFRDQLLHELSEVQSVQFLDTPRLLADGYGLASMLASALANGTRSPRRASRDAGLILPSYPELAAGARAMVTVARTEGDDLVQITAQDRSFLVNGVALLSIVERVATAVAPMAIAGARQQSARAATAREPFVFEVDAPEAPEAPEQEHDHGGDHGHGDH